MSNLSKLFPSGSCVLIDAGLGSTLQKVFHVDTASSIWSSEALVKCPESIIEAHLLFLKAGACLIETASYQGSFSTYARAGYSQDDAIRLMRSSVTLAAEARSRFAAEANVPIDSVKIALSLASYGASLNRAHEYDGYYPPPYGPQAYVFPADPTNPNRNAFRADEREQEVQSEDALTEFHLERLRVYAEDKQTWRSLDALAFETIPLAREVRAIRRAIAVLEDKMAPEDHKPWWVCAVYASNEFPEERPSREGGRLGAKEVLAAYFDDVPNDAVAGCQNARYPVPDAFGINCTSVGHVASAVAAISEVLAEMGDDTARVGGGQPWLKRPLGDEWARELGEIVRAAGEKRVWGGILVGGCCTTGDGELRSLRKVLESL
ncbi:Homocysteine S-methyltransferase [Multifurca ochricompacta]|uniref:Homocysteine S-methyltransferase n=1 Tax=Multifurca ochricompacta TaxID=376703 RepID=A0AAD4QMA3_9AGAM|nr:Homocysteine S-methyltransferase [Multifurca ochricompacta]